MDKMKNSGMSETMQTLTRKSACVMLSLLLLLSVVLPVKAAAETAPAKVVRVGSFEDTFNYVNEKGARKGYGYELLETLSGYTGWQFEYVTCDWSNCFEKLKNGEIDIMGGISYTEDRTEEMLFSDEPMGVEKYYLYADLSRADISASDFKTLNGKKIGVLMGTEPEVMLTEWEEKYGLETEHVNISNNEDVKQKLANHEIDCFVSLEESFWAERGISTITRVGESGIYYAINKNRPDIKEELDDAMRALDEAAPFYTADLYKRYFSMDYTPILTGEEKAWLKEHGAIKMGFLMSDSGVSTFDPATGEFTGVITDYIQFAADCLGNQELEFQLVGYDSKETELDALESGEIDLIFGKNMIDADAISQYLDSDKFTVGLSDPTSTRHIVMNTTHEILGDPAVRKALQHATDRQTISDGIFYGLEQPADTLYATTVPYCNVGLKPYEYSTETAAQILDEAGWVLGSDKMRAKDGKQLALDLLYNSDSVTEKTIAEYLQSEYLKLGISMTIHGEEEQSYRDNMKAGNFDMVFNICWGMPYDPQSSLAAMRAPVYGDYAAQQGLADKAEIDDAITRILTSTDETERQELYKSVLTNLHEDAMYLPLTYECNKALYTSTLHGVHFGTDQYDVPFADMYFE